MGSSSKLSCALRPVGLETSSCVANTSPSSGGSTAEESVLCGVIGLLPERLDALALAVSTLGEGEDEPSNLLKDLVEATFGRADAVDAMMGEAVD